MHLLYIDESGTPEVPGNSSHFVLAGISIPVNYWKGHDQDISVIKNRYNLGTAEIHAGWLLRPYLEQRRIPNFERLNYVDRKTEVTRLRNEELLRLQRVHDSDRYHKTKKNFRQTDSYIHLTYDQRGSFVSEVATKIGQWGFARLFAECVDKLHFDRNRAGMTIEEQCFDQLVSRFHRYLDSIGHDDENCCGLLIHDNNEAVERRHTQMMRRFYERGTTWTDIHKIIETPLFVDSQLTSMVQVADLCAYALRTYLENRNANLFTLIFPRADRRNGLAVGVRHFTRADCNCQICSEHRTAINRQLVP
jgi:hypothetical protein